MKTLLLIGLILDGIIFIASVLLQSPKGGGLGLGLGGASAGGNEYGSKKTMEWKLQKIAIITGIIFVIICLFLPYVR